MDLGKHLGFAVPASGLSFAQNDPDTNSTTIRGNKRKSIDTSTPIRKKSRSDSTLEASNLEFSMFSCSLCHKNFASKYLLKKHAKDCYEVSTIEEIPTEEESGKKKCENCGESFAIKGGWITKHQNSCLSLTGVTQVETHEALPEIPNKNKTETCEKCQKDFPVQGGWFTKHVAKCTANLNETLDENLGSKCPKCNKHYAPHVLKHLKNHIAKCTGIASEPDSPQIGTLEDYEKMYQQEEWSCFTCGKWFGRRDVLKSHIVTHYKKEIRSEFMQNGPSNVCQICGFVAVDSRALLHHISISTHQKLKQFLPEFAANLLFPETEVKPEKELKCCICQKEFREKTSLMDHIVEHFSEQIGEKFIENGIKCKVCQYHDANLGQLTKHVALQHEKIREYLPGKLKIKIGPKTG